jgi:uncharacterized membrane protein
LTCPLINWLSQIEISCLIAASKFFRGSNIVMSIVKTVFKYLLAIVMVGAGVNHFLDPGFYLKLMPPYLPWHLPLVYLSGIFEILLGLLLMIQKYTRLAAWGLIALLIAVFPANIHMAMNTELFPHVNPNYHWIRLPFQGVFIAWAYWFTRPDRSKS